MPLKALRRFWKSENQPGKTNNILEGGRKGLPYQFFESSLFAILTYFPSQF
jgi:hypothetical protein